MHHIVQLLNRLTPMPKQTSPRAQWNAQQTQDQMTLVRERLARVGEELAIMEQRDTGEP